MKLEVKLNQKQIPSIKEFMYFDNRCSNMQKNTVFIIQNGTDDESQLLQLLRDMDYELTDNEGQKKPGYDRVSRLDSYIDAKERERYLVMYDQWAVAAKKGRYGERRFPFQFVNGLWDETYKQAFTQIVEEYYQEMAAESKRKSFVLTLFKWIDVYFPKLFLNTKALSKFPKFVYTGHIRANEYLFFKLLALCGCDVYCINLAEQLDVKWDKVSFSAQVFSESRQIVGHIPEYHKEKVKSEQIKSCPAPLPVERPKRTSGTVDGFLPAAPVRDHDRMLEYEELAQLASSVVMITVYDDKKKPLGTGSGVLINSQGYILTNFHVVRGGSMYAVRLEEDEQIQYTSELVKYHPPNDMALLRIEPVNRNPIPVYSGEKLIRGQKVVAIGSPLGLFNTVSDGIIAGFRSLNNLSMIQFTAPTSHGSSGGALLNRYGQLVGIVTAGFDDGQNLNLAVDYETVHLFLRGFI